MTFLLTIHPALEKDPSFYTEFEFETKEEMMAASNTAADLLLVLSGEIDVMEDFSNVFEHHEFIDGDWELIEEE